MSKKLTLSAVSVALVLAMLVVGTVAFLTARSNGGEAISNSFVASDGLIEDAQDDDPTGNGIFITETDIDDPENVTTTGNEYVVVPNVPITKDARLNVRGKTDLPAYVFIEVCDNLNEKLSYEGIVDDWVDLELTGPNGGNVYAYKSVITDDLEDQGILIDDEITVADDYTAEDGGTLDFYAYICQEGSFEQGEGEFADAATAAFNACFAD